MLKPGEEVPELFDDPLMKRASQWVLSTSALVSKHLREYGWGEVSMRVFSFFGKSMDTGIRLCRMALGLRTSLALTVRPN